MGPKKASLVLADHQALPEKDEVEKAPLGGAGKAHVGLEVGEVGVFLGAPGDGVADALQEDAEVDLTGVRGDHAVLRA